MTPDAPRSQHAQRVDAPIGAMGAALGWLAQRERSVRHALRLRSEVARLERGLRAGLKPIVVYSPQKTGSTAASAALEARPELVISKVHTLVSAHDWDGNLRNRVHADGTILIGSHYADAARRVFLQPRRAAQFVVTLREPVATNLSWFAFTAHRIWLRDRRRSLAALSSAHLANLFLERFPHQSVAVWPSVELGAALGVDPYAVPFPHAQGWLRLRSPPWDILVMRSDLADASKSSALSQFTGVEGIAVGRARESGDGTAGIYARLKEGIRAHPSYIRSMLATPYARHFWSERELRDIESRWLSQRNHPAA